MSKKNRADLVVRLQALEKAGGDIEIVVKQLDQLLRLCITVSAQGENAASDFRYFCQSAVAGLAKYYFHPRLFIRCIKIFNTICGSEGWQKAKDKDWLHYLDGLVLRTQQLRHRTLDKKYVQVTPDTFKMKAIEEIWLPIADTERAPTFKNSTFLEIPFIIFPTLQTINDVDAVLTFLRILLQKPAVIDALHAVANLPIASVVKFLIQPLYIVEATRFGCLDAGATNALWSDGRLAQHCRTTNIFLLQLLSPIVSSEMCSQFLAEALLRYSSEISVNSKPVASAATVWPGHLRTLAEMLPLEVFELAFEACLTHDTSVADLVPLLVDAAGGSILFAPRSASAIVKWQKAHPSTCPFLGAGLWDLRRALQV
eukprot:TRINITY_DN94743_c0_g1_i1.p1 TRINITY_DN94743_c0_g1~~TRINITY_DN94743_c0_g1_i1.p1  ORF type:complete len:370 (+),score=53.92 TRINITY_DN94743_c0_g1_i1:36-1145(+)